MMRLNGACACWEGGRNEGCEESVTVISHTVHGEFLDVFAFIPQAFNSNGTNHTLYYVTSMNFDRLVALL
jgi:hypothetical protein